jgi:hypothetical protein
MYIWERIVLIRQRYRKLKFNNRIASRVTHLAGPGRIGFHARRAFTRRASYSRPEYVIRRTEGSRGFYVRAILAIRAVDTFPVSASQNFT